MEGFIIGGLYLLGAVQAWFDNCNTETVARLKSGEPNLAMVPWEKSLSAAAWPIYTVWGLYIYLRIINSKKVTPSE
jgi:hypothetical protein